MDKVTFVEIVETLGAESAWEAVNKELRLTERDKAHAAAQKAKEAKDRAENRAYNRSRAWEHFKDTTLPALGFFAFIGTIVGGGIWAGISGDRDKARGEAACNQGRMDACIRAYGNAGRGDGDRQKMLAALYQAKTGQKLPGAD